MNEKFCAYCDTLGVFTTCACRYSGILDCADKAACIVCQKAHRTLGMFFKALAATRPTVRANAPRLPLLQILHETICQHGEIKEREYCFRLLHSTSAFDENEQHFRSCMLGVARALPLNASIAETIVRKGTEMDVVRILERLDYALRAKAARENQDDVATLLDHAVSLARRA
jgi:hypothetical protein